MTRYFTMEYWIDKEWYVGRLKEVPGVFSQGKTLEELQVNIADAYHLIIEETTPVMASPSSTIEIGLEV